MPSLFGSAKSSRTIYRKIDQQGSDSEFSLSDDEKVLFKRQGEIELHLYPETQIKRPKKTGATYKRYLGISVAILVIVLSLTVVAIVYSRSHNSESSPVKTTNPVQQTVTNGKDQSETNTTTTKPLPGMKIDTSGEGWQRTFKDTGGEGSIRLLDMDEDGLDDVLIGGITIFGGRVNHDEYLTKFADLRHYCTSKGENVEYPCLGSLIALRGLDGSELWRLPIRSDAFVLNCEEFDINKDGKMDCIGTGRMSVVVAFDPYKGEVLWTCEDDDFLRSDWNTYKAVALPDWNGDGVPEVLIANGGDVNKEPDDHDREPGRLVMLSGATGVPMGDRYLNMPHSKETYMSPVLYTPYKDSATYILFGSGGETVPGDLMGISEGDFCLYILGENTDVCPQDRDKQYEVNRDGQGVFVIYKGQEKGIIVPPVIVDVDGDDIMDLLMTAFEGVVKLYNGQQLIEMWTTTFPGSESYSTPAPGYFDDDNHLDFIIHWSQGEWISYNSSNTTVVSGADGSILWTLGSAYMQMSSSLTISTNLIHQDLFLFRTQGRESKFRWNDGRLVRPDKNTDRKKRHEESNGGLSNMSHEAIMKKMHDEHLSCDDDLSSFQGEIFVLDRTMLQNPIRLLSIPTNTHTYDPSTINFTLDQLQSNHDNIPHPVEGGVNSETPSPDQGETGGSHVNPRGIKPGSDDSSRVVMKRETGEKKTSSPRACVVEKPDIMSLGAIGDLDGDNNLDFVFLNEVSAFLMDSTRSAGEELSEIIVHKMNMEIGIQDGVFKHVPVNAETSMTPPPHSAGIPGNKQKTFLPIKQQKWTQYLGTNGKSTFA